MIHRMSRRQGDESRAQLLAYLKRQYRDFGRFPPQREAVRALKWSNVRLVSYHLEKLVENGDVLMHVDRRRRKVLFYYLSQKQRSDALDEV